MSLTLEKMSEVTLRMLETQDRLNQTVIGPDNLPVGEAWTQQNWEYGLGGAVEAIEAIDYTNWAWWKPGKYNQSLSDEQLLNIQVELADIAHFALSMTFINAKYNETDKEYLRQNLEYSSVEIAAAFKNTEPVCRDHKSDQALRRQLRKLAAYLLLDQIDWNILAKSAALAGMDFVRFSAFFFGKVALNEFRWANGYKEGRYPKKWRWILDPDKMVEDNVHLFDIMNYYLEHSKVTAMQMIQAGSFQSTILRDLQKRYNLCAI